MKKTISSHPGAISYRFSIMIILILIFIIYFLTYFDETQKEVERASILQTKRIIDSALTIVFATHATGGKLDELAGIDGSNPFDFLEQYNILPPAYRGEIETRLSLSQDPGWYYLRQPGRVVYKSAFGDDDWYFRVSFSYEDENNSGKYESAFDRFKSLQFVKIAQIKSASP